MPAHDAMRSYVELLREVLPIIPSTKEVAEYLALHGVDGATASAAGPQHRDTPYLPRSSAASVERSGDVDDDRVARNEGKARMLPPDAAIGSDTPALVSLAAHGGLPGGSPRRFGSPSTALSGSVGGAPSRRLRSDRSEDADSDEEGEVFCDTPEGPAQVSSAQYTSPMPGSALHARQQPQADGTPMLREHPDNDLLPPPVRPAYSAADATATTAADLHAIVQQIRHDVADVSARVSAIERRHGSPTEVQPMRAAGQSWRQSVGCVAAAVRPRALRG